MVPCPAFQEIISAIERQNCIFSALPLFLIGEYITGISRFPLFNIHPVHTLLSPVQGASAALPWLSFSGSVSNGGP